MEAKYQPHKPNSRHSILFLQNMETSDTSIINFNFNFLVPGYYNLC
jgi:hypothetical protein